MAVEIGDMVQVVDRDQLPGDQKSGLFYNHFRGLTGSVDRVYADGNICVVVNHDSLTRDMLVRLKRAEKIIKPRWKNANQESAKETAPEVPAGDDADEAEGVSAAQALAEMDGSDDQKVNPGLRYAVVLSASDVLVLESGGGARVVSDQQLTDVPVARVRESDLAAAEERYMNELARRSESQKK